MIIRNKVADDRFYKNLDKGIRFAVRVLHSRGFDTCQSCEGGKGHAYPEPTVDLPINTDDAQIFGALAALAEFGLPVQSIAIVWNVKHGGMINEKIGRIIFRTKMEDRADEIPNFVWSYVAMKGPK